MNGVRSLPLIHTLQILVFSDRGTFLYRGLTPLLLQNQPASPFPALVFNAHRQFRHLKVDGAFQKMQKEIRRREMKIQGTRNPNLSDFGEQSEARQYAGNATQQVWSCPFSKKINL